MGLLRGRRGISILAGAMLLTGTINTIATKLQVRRKTGRGKRRGGESMEQEGTGGGDSI